MGLSQPCVPVSRKEGHPSCAHPQHGEVFSDPIFVTAAPSSCLISIPNGTCSVCWFLPSPRPARMATGQGQLVCFLGSCTLSA